MRVVIAGSRNLKVSTTLIKELLEQFKIKPTRILSGGATGVDFAGEKYAKENEIELKQFPANWDEFGKSAGPRRNRVMAHNADALLLIWDGKSRGSKNMKEQAIEKELYICEVILNSF